MTSSSDAHIPDELRLLLKTRYGVVEFEVDRDGDMMIELEEQYGNTPRVYLNRAECSQLREFLNGWLDR